MSRGLKGRMGKEYLAVGRGDRSIATADEWILCLVWQVAAALFSARICPPVTVLRPPPLLRTLEINLPGIAAQQGGREWGCRGLDARAHAHTPTWPFQAEDGQRDSHRPVWGSICGPHANEPIRRVEPQQQLHVLRRKHVPPRMFDDGARPLVVHAWFGWDSPQKRGYVVRGTPV